MTRPQRRKIPFHVSWLRAREILVVGIVGLLLTSKSLGQTGVQFRLSDLPGEEPTNPTYNLPELQIEDLNSLVASPSPPPTRSGRYCVSDEVRSGCPQLVSPFATRSLNCDEFSLGRIGGGTLLGGETANPTHDGTWAIDYTGKWIPRYVFLPWSHGLRYQGGYGAYGTEAPFNPHTRHSHE